MLFVYLAFTPIEWHENFGFHLIDKLTSYYSESDPHLFGFSGNNNGARAYWFLVGRQILLHGQSCFINLCEIIRLHPARSEGRHALLCCFLNFGDRSSLKDLFDTHLWAPSPSCHSLLTFFLHCRIVISYRTFSSVSKIKSSKNRIPFVRRFKPILQCAFFSCFLLLVIVHILYFFLNSCFLSPEIKVNELWKNQETRGKKIKLSIKQS